MNSNKLTVLFLLQKVRQNKKGECPIRCRITFNKLRKEFSTGCFIKPLNWNSKKQQAKPPSADNDFLNYQLSLISQKISQAFLFLEVNVEKFDVNDLYNQYKGKQAHKEKCLLEVYKEFLARIFKLIDKEIKLVTYRKYEESEKHLSDYIRWKNKAADVPLKSILSNFIDDYEYYLKAEKNLQAGTIYKALQRFRKVIRYAVANNYLEKDPFLHHKSVRPRKILVYLTPSELKNLEAFRFAQPRLNQIRDMFVFCCYTGLAFNEMSKLTINHIVVGFDSKRWIRMEREKTNKEIAIPLLDISTNIIEKYKKEDSIAVFPTISNQKFNSYLKEIAEITGINKNLTHHLARKTFATTVLLYNDVPMEVVSELLGHSKMSITQEYYGKVVQKKISDYMINLGDRLKK